MKDRKKILFTVFTLSRGLSGSVIIRQATVRDVSVVFRLGDSLEFHHPRKKERKRASAKGHLVIANHSVVCVYTLSGGIRSVVATINKQCGGHYKQTNKHAW